MKAAKGRDSDDVVSRTKTSKYRGVYLDTTMNKWVVYLEKHNHHPCFQDERAAGIYAEYFLRQLYGITPNFPELDDDALTGEFESIMSQREQEAALRRSSSKQGIKKRSDTSSQYVGVYKKRSTHWAARIHFKGKVMNLGTFSILDPDAEKKAAMAYDKMALALYGDNANLNFPKNKL